LNGLALFELVRAHFLNGLLRVGLGAPIPCTGRRQARLKRIARRRVKSVVVIGLGMLSILDRFRSESFDELFTNILAESVA
jgi:hypothetical protein